MRCIVLLTVQRIQSASKEQGLDLPFQNGEQILCYIDLFPEPKSGICEVG